MGFSGSAIYSRYPANYARLVAFYSQPFRWLRRVKGGTGRSGLAAVLRLDEHLKRAVSVVVSVYVVCMCVGWTERPRAGLAIRDKDF